MKYRAKPFIDVTVDRLSKGAGALLILVLIKDWGLGLTWQQLSYASLSIMVLWIFFALRARAEYMAAFRRSIVQQDMKAGEIRLETADLSTIEALVEELAHPEPKRVAYALDLLESLDKRHLVSPLMLYHEDPDVRVRVLRLAEATGPTGAGRWLRGIQRSLTDHEGEVRGAAVRALASVKGEEAAALMRPYLDDADPALVVTAASALSNSTDPADLERASKAFRELIDDSRAQRAHTRAEVARALGRVTNPDFRPLLVPLMFDADVDVARDAIRSAARLGAGDFLYVPPLVSLLRNRLLKGAARDVLVELRRGRRPDARLLHEGSRRGSLGAAPHPGDPGQDSVPGVAAGAARRARRPRRVPALQGAVGLATAAPQPARSRRAAADGREADRRRDQPRLRSADTALQPVPCRRPRSGLSAGARLDREVRAGLRSRVHAAGARASTGGHRRRTPRAHDRRRPGAFECGRVPRQHSSAATPGIA